MPQPAAMIEKLLANPQAEGVRLLYVTPLRAMTKDLELALKDPLVDSEVRVLSRNGDTSAKDRASLFRQPPQILMTTPESSVGHFVVTQISGAFCLLGIGRRR